MDAVLSIPEGKSDAIIYQISLDQNQLDTIKLPPSLDGVKIKFVRSVAGIHGFWTPTEFFPQMRVAWSMDFTAAATHFTPFAMLLDVGLHNKLAIGVENLDDEVNIAVGFDANHTECSITLTFQYNDHGNTIYLDTRPAPWQESVAAYRDWAKSAANLTNIKFPAAAYDPVYCTWYAFYADFDEKMVEKCASGAAELGFKTFILDDGWSFDTRKRTGADTPGIPWYAQIGDFEPSKNKFTNFTDHVKRVKAMKLRYLLWVTPVFVGCNSMAVKKYATAFRAKGPAGGMEMAIQDAKFAEYIHDTFIELARENALDGFKVDFIDSYLPKIGTAVGERKGEYRKFLENLLTELRQIKPEALVEFRLNYANLAMLRAATNFRVYDCPMDFLVNLKGAAFMHLMLGDEVPIHSDPAYWAKDESAENVSRHLMAAMAGVPMISTAPEQLSDTAKNVIRHLLKFYTANQSILARAKWRIITAANGEFAALTANGAGKSFVYLLDVKYLAEALILTPQDNEKWIFNFSNEVIPTQNNAFTPEGKFIAGKILPGALGKL